jgi:large subunit ribosomal protein L19
MKLIEKIEQEQLNQKNTDFKVGDWVKVSTRVKEGDKERTQIYAGMVIGRKGRGINESFTVRRISYGEGVERVFPLHSPFIEKILVETPGRARRAKLYHVRGLKGALTVKPQDKNAKAAAKAKKDKAAAAEAAAAAE